MIAHLLLIVTLITPLQKSPFDVYRWQYRIIILDQEMISAEVQLEQLLDKKHELLDRDLLVFTKLGTTMTCVNAEEKPLQYLGNRYKGFSLIGKDGSLKLHQENLIDVQLIFDLIDSMPMRQAEMRGRSN